MVVGSGSPDLYRLDARLLDGDEQAISTAHVVFGVRTIRLERSPDRFTYFLNERPVFLRGTSYMPALYLSECSRELLAGDLALARDANLNLLRVHVHVAPPELYDLCDRAGMLVWQDFELNWVQDPSPEFEQRARALQRDMIDLLGNHPSIMTWACHNEPTMVFARRSNLEHRPDPALYADACAAGRDAPGLHLLRANRGRLAALRRSPRLLRRDLVAPLHRLLPPSPAPVFRVRLRSARRAEHPARSTPTSGIAFST